MFVYKGSETETRELLGGTKENKILPDEGGGIDLPSRQIIEILQRANKIKIALVTRPGRHSWRFGAELWW